MYTHSRITRVSAVPKRECGLGFDGMRNLIAKSNTRFGSPKVHVNLRAPSRSAGPLFEKVLCPAMRDVEMADDAGGVVVQHPVDPLHKSSAVSSIPLPTTQHEADLYATLKKLERDLEFLTLQEVRSIYLIPALLAFQTTNHCG